MIKALLNTRALVLLLICTLVLAVAACGDDDKTTGGDGQPQTQFDGTIKIGDISDLSGVVGGSPIVLSFKLGMDKAVRDINAAGGVNVGGKKYKFEIIQRDSRSESTVVVAAAEELVQEGVFAANIGTLLYFDAAYQRFKPAGVLSFMVLPQGLALLEKEPEKNLLLASPIELATPIIVGWAKQIYTIYPQTGKRIAYVAQDDALGHAMEVGNREAAKAIGGELVHVEYMPIGTTDFTTYLTNVKAKDPDVVYSYSGAAQLEFTTQALQLDVAPILEIPGFIAAYFPLLPDVGDTKIVAVDWRLPFTRGLTPDQYIEDVEDLGELPGGLPPQTGFAIAYHDWIYLLKQAIEKVGSLEDAEAVSKALVGLTYGGPYGSVEVLPDRTTRGTMGLVVAEKTKFTVYVYDDVGDTSPNLTLEALPSAVR